MTRYLALLRGINVGGKNVLPMAALRDALVHAGYGGVATYIQSGNVVLSSSTALKSLDIANVITVKFGIDIAVMIRTEREIEATLANNPFAAAAPKTVHVGFLSDPVHSDALEDFDGDSFNPDRFAVHPREIYFELPNGMGNAKLVPALQRRIKNPMTVRNLQTVQKLAEMLHER